MRRRTKVTVAGKECDAWEEEFETVREEWNQYKLLDGGTVRIKVVPVKFFKLIDSGGKELRNPDGDPQVLVRHNLQISASD